MEPSKEEASNQLKGIWAVSGKKAEGSPLAHKEFSMGLVDLKGLRSIKALPPLLRETCALSGGWC